MTGQVYIAAAYCRLSRDDGGLESVSIETQKKIIADYCKSNGIMIYDYYCDDGFTGTNFDRPQFQKMIQDIEEKKVNTVIVKDLSRMGRDSAEVSNWVDKRFFECGIRFIALGDNIDSGIAEYDSFYFAVRNVFNEMYPLDCSKKTKMALTTRAKNGQFVGSKAPYGYKKSETDKHILEIDENVSDNVKLIFKLASENNYGFNKIARVLSEIRIPTPKEYAEKKENPSCDWNLTSVKKILEDEV
ncbi:MAG: recombinase family protein, partial [Clostridia bacterium]|nr:recombinase family protein [Clostridia bacterium]